MEVPLLLTWRLDMTAFAHRALSDTGFWAWTFILVCSLFLQPWHCWRAKAKRKKVSVCCSGVTSFLSLYHSCWVFSAVMLWRMQCVPRRWVSAAVMRLGCVNSADSQEDDMSWHFDFRNRRVTRGYDKSISFYLVCKHKLADLLKASVRVELTINILGESRSLSVRNCACSLSPPWFHSAKLWVAVFTVNAWPNKVTTIIWRPFSSSSFFFLWMFGQPWTLSIYKPTHSDLPSTGGKKDILCVQASSPLQLKQIQVFRSLKFTIGSLKSHLLFFTSWNGHCGP